MLILLLQLFTSHSGDPLMQSTDELANTNWECKIGKGCTDQLRFKAGHKVVAYSCELGEESPGTYQLFRDTLIVNSIKDGEEMKERWRYKYLLREGRLRPISSEEFIHRKWQMVRSVFELNYILLKATNNTLGQQIPTGKAGGGIDTTVNNALKLLDPASIRQNIGNQRGNFIEDDQATRVQFANKTNNEYLILYHLDGSNSNSFNEFEIGLLNSKERSFKTTTFPSFYTESGVHVGMTMESLIAMKGKKFERTGQKGNIVLTYQVTDNNVANHILIRYNMPIYEAQYFFRGNRLIKFIFGFPDL